MKISKYGFSLVVALCCLLFAQTAWADIQLPKPQKTGGKGVLELLDARASGARGAFPTKTVSEQELSTILWAATGLNRGGKGWTVPMAMGKEPYVHVYVLSGKGGFRYDWKKHALVEVTNKNIIAAASPDAFVRSAPYVLVFVSDASRTADTFGYVAAGAMSQNVYLAAENAGVATRYIVTLKDDAIKKELKLQGGVPIVIMPLGKK